MSDDDARTIRAALDRFRAVPADPGDLCARFHGYRTNPPLSEEAVVQFESDHRIRLPEDYRTFLIRVGNGGAGPAYGVFKLGERDEGWGHIPWAENDGYIGTLSVPFPHNGPWNELPVEPAYDRSNVAEYERRMNEEEARYFDPAHLNGAMPICHYGCNQRVWLAVTGSEAGNVWWDDRADRDGIYPFTSGTAARVSFFKWYREWLERELDRLVVNP